jgi:phosphotransferase system IIB component
MIQGTTKTEELYRAVMLDSSSSLKDFSMDRKKYHRKYILNEDIKEKDSVAANLGRLVETMLWEPELFDEKFFMSTVAYIPTGLMLEFIERLYEVTLDSTDESGNISRSFKELAEEAYTLSSFKIKFEQVLKKFIGSDAELYYNEIRQVRSKNLTVVDTQQVATAEKIIETLKTDPNVKDIVNCVTSQRYDVKDQMQVEDYTVDGHRFKSMMDRVIVDHQDKTIQVYDLKCTWNVENFYEEYYLYRRAYIQAYLYMRAAEYAFRGYDQYTVLAPRFLVCDSANYFRPLIYVIDPSNLYDAYNGFEHKGRKYPGVKDLIDQLSWAHTNNIWNISQENLNNNGITILK